MRPEPLTAADIMVRNVVSLCPDDLVHDAMRLLVRRGYSGAPVLDDDRRLVGVFSERDCIQAMVRATVHAMPPAQVGEVMTREVLTVPPDAGLLTIAHRFLTRPVRRLPVVCPWGRSAAVTCCVRR